MFKVIVSEVKVIASEVKVIASEVKVIAWEVKVIVSEVKVIAWEVKVIASEVKVIAWEVKVTQQNLVSSIACELLKVFEVKHTQILSRINYDVHTAMTSIDLWLISRFF